MYLRILVGIQYFRAQHGGLDFGARGLRSLGISYLHLFGGDRNFNVQFLDIDCALGYGSDYDVIVSEARKQARFINMHCDQGTWRIGIQRANRSLASEQKPRQQELAADT